MPLKAYLAAAAVALSPVAASAASVDINFQAFGSVENSDLNIAGASAALNAFIGSAPIFADETFDGYTACNDITNGICDSGPVQSTSVGTFTGIGGTQSNGGSQVDPKDNIVIRSSTPNAFARYNVVGAEDRWLDSNDMNGIKWEIPGASSLSNIIRIAFFLTDVNDVGSTAFNITAAGTTDVITPTVTGLPANSNRPNGELLLVTMDFSEALDIINISMTTGVGDGFGIDGIKVAAVPLPAAGFLLLGGLGGLAALRRRKRKAA